MKSIKRKVLALILSISSISGFSIGAMKCSGGRWYTKEQFLVKSRDIGLPKKFYKDLKLKFMDIYKTNILMDMKGDVESKIKILKAFKENAKLSDSCISSVIEKLIDGSVEEADYDKLLNGFSRFTHLINGFGFFIYYKRYRNGEISEVGLIHNRRKEKKITMLRNYEKFRASQEIPKEMYDNFFFHDTRSSSLRRYFDENLAREFDEKLAWEKDRDHEVHIMPVMMTEESK